ncbi:NACHT domain-containing protein [Streptomyces sp. NPDC002004]
MGSTPEQARAPEPGPSAVYNVVQHSTVEYLIQAGYVHGDITVNLPPRPGPLDTAAEALARSVRAQWSAEVGAWQLGEVGAPLAVRWRAEWGESDGGTPPAPSPARSDRVGDVVDGLLSRRERRLVVLGGPGSGKSTFLALLVLALADGHLGDLTRQRAGDRSLPVPVLLTLESWTAETTPFKEWLTARITEDHPGLPRVDGAHPAERLIREFRVLPVLDGLDELPEQRRHHVIAGLGTALGSRGLGVVLAARTDAYARLTHPLPGASTLTARPVTPEDAADHLGRASGTDRWYPVEREIAAHPEGPLAQALSTPLMIWLARRVYAPPERAPAELADRARLPSRTAIEAHLLDGAVPAAFAAVPHDPDRLHAPGRWNPERARGWLAYLAGRLSGNRITEFAWWRLPQLARLRLLAVLTLTAVAALCGETVMAVTDRVHAAYGQRMFFGETGERLDLLGGVMWASGIRLSVMIWFGDRFGRPRRRANPLRAGAALRSASRAVSVRRGARAAGVLVGPAALFLLIVRSAHDAGAYTWWVLLGFVVPTLLMALIAAPADTEDAATPDTLMASERRTALLTLGVVAPVVGAGSALLSALTSGGAADSWIAGAKAFTGAAAVLVLLSPWALWVVAKAWLALAGRVPWSLMEFLRDGHTTGLLQRNAGVYRFRHLRLQEHLAGAARPPHPESVPQSGPRPPNGPVPRHMPFPQSGPVAPDVPLAQNVPLQRTDRGRTRAATPAPPPGPATLPPMHTLRGWTVIDNAEQYVLDGRARRVPLAHWKVVGAAGAVALVRYAMAGQWDVRTGLAAVLLWPVIGVLINLVALCLPRQRLRLQIDRGGLHTRIGRHSAVYRWDDITELAVRPVRSRGRDTKYYGPHVRLRPDPHRPEPHRIFHGAAGWYLVLPTHFRPAVPPDVAAALARFGGTRWQGPTGHL